MTNVQSVHAADIVGYAVEAADAHVGKVDKRSGGPQNGYFVVSIGHVFTKVTLPLSAIAEVDDDAQILVLAIGEEEAKAAPEYTDDESAIYFDKPI